MLSCKFAAYFQNTFSQEHLQMAASETQGVRTLKKKQKKTEDKLKLAEDPMQANKFKM